MILKSSRLIVDAMGCVVAVVERCWSRTRRTLSIATSVLPCVRQRKVV